MTDCDGCLTNCVGCENFETIVCEETDLDRLRELRKALIRYKVKADNSWSGRFADLMSSQVGTMRFFFTCAAIVTVPLCFPVCMPIIGYLSSGYMQLLLPILLMIAANRVDAVRAVKAEREYRITLVSDRIDEMMEG